VLIQELVLSGINENTRVAIIGTSFIGMELAGSIMKKGPKSVDVIGTDPVPFEKILGADIGKAIQKVNSSVTKHHFEGVYSSDSIEISLRIWKARASNSTWRLA
jgi:pyruvate/2-oxoglutarate dehydrogenase complex dihydrolipoamide dehydrogenase (E3) component